jgi:hypothetical protein
MTAVMARQFLVFHISGTTDDHYHMGCYTGWMLRYGSHLLRDSVGSTAN